MKTAGGNQEIKSGEATMGEAQKNKTKTKATKKSNRMQSPHFQLFYS